MDGEVAPLAGAWIEIVVESDGRNAKTVAPLAGAWIEIPKQIFSAFSISSLPSRERGLKFTAVEQYRKNKLSLPSRERGLK